MPTDAHLDRVKRDLDDYWNRKNAEAAEKQADVREDEDGDE